MSQLRHRSATAGLTALLTVGALVMSGAAAGADPPAATPATAAPATAAPAAAPATAPVDRPAASAPPVEITLITGDTVSYAGSPDGGYELDVTDSESSLRILSDATGVYAVPDRAQPLIAAGVLDRQLFNVSYLAAHGYTDAETDQLPLIVTYPRPAGPAPGAGLQRAAAVPARDLSARAGRLPATTAAVGLASVNGASVAVDKPTAEGFWEFVGGAAATDGAGQRRAGPSTSRLAGGIDSIWLDRTMEVSLADSVPQIGAPSAWDAGFDGTGVRVGVLDTGYDSGHPDLAGRVVAAEGFTGDGSVRDGHGHGTHVASTIAGTGAASGGDYTGVAPGADLVVGKVCTDAGGCLTSQVIAGMEWAVQQGAAVVNMSLGGLPSDGSDPFSRAVDDLTASSGTLFVISAGNRGPDSGTVAQPAAAASALAVAAIDSQDTVAGFSSRGPLPGSSHLKPDIAAPGVLITAARSAHGTDMGGNAGPVGEHYLRASGTSMAAPHVAGAAAILAQRHPDWTAGQLKAALMSSAAPIGQSPYEIGAGRVDPAHAVTETVFATTGSLDFGLRPWPHEGAVDTRTLTYRNIGDQQVTLDLALDTTDVGGVPAPEGLLSLSTDRLTIPAGGTAEVTVTLTEAASTGAGMFGGSLVASAGGDLRAHTPVGVVLGEPQYAVTFELILPAEAETDPAAPACAGQQVSVADMSDFRFRNGFVEPDCTVTFTLYERPHMVYTWIAWPGPDGSRVEVGGFLPEFTPSENLTVPIDLRQARPLRVESPRPTEVARRWVTFTRATEQRTGNVSGGRALAHPTAEVRVLPTGPVSRGRFHILDQLTMVTPFVTMEVTGPGGFDLAARYHDGDVAWPKLSGSGQLDLVDAGLGAEADFDGLEVAGKLVLIGGDGYDPAAMRQAAARATAAGASAMLHFADAPMGLSSDAGLSATRADAPTIVVPPSQGWRLRELAAAGPVRVSYSGVPVSPDVYFTRVLHDQVPAGDDPLVRVLSEADFAQVRASYHADAPTVVRRDAVARPDYIAVVAYDHLPVAAPLVRTEHYGPIHEELVWVDRYEQNGMFAFWVNDRPAWQGRDEIAFGLPGALPRPVHEPPAPGAQQPAGFWNREQNICHVCRDATRLTVAIPYANGDGLWSLLPLSQGQLPPGGPAVPALELGLTVDGQEQPAPGKVIGRAYDPTLQFAAHVFPLPEGDHELALTQRLQEFAPRPHGRSSQTTWRFTAGPPADSGQDYRCFQGTICTAQQVIFLDYDLSGLGLDNTAPAGRRFSFDVTPRFQQGTGTEVTEFSAEVSYDGGGAWEPAEAVRLAGSTSYRVSVTHPAATAGDKVSVRITAGDRDGNQVVQTQPDLYGLNPDSCPEGHDDPTIRFGDSDSGVANPPGADGCTFLDQVWEHGPYRNHGQFVSTVRELVRQWERDGLFSKREAQAVTVAAARSQVGKPGGPAILH